MVDPVNLEKKVNILGLSYPTPLIIAIYEWMPPFYFSMLLY